MDQKLETLEKLAGNKIEGRRDGWAKKLENLEKLAKNKIEGHRDG